MAQFQRTNGVPPSGGQAEGGAARFQAVSSGTAGPGPSGMSGRLQDERAQQISRVQNVRRRRRHGSYIIYYILLGLILTIVCVVLSFTVFFNVQAISPSGSAVYSREEILAAVNAKAGDNLLRLNTDKIEEDALKILTKAESVEVKRHFPDQLDIVVTDGDPILQVSEGGAFYQFTESGRLIGIAVSAAVDAQVVIGPDVSGLVEGQYITSLTKEQQATLSTWRTIRDELWDYSIHDISAMNLSDELRLRIYYQNRIEIDIGPLTDMDAKMATLKAILYESGTVGVDETGRIDLTNPDRVYFNNQTACSPPAGAAQAGWSWTDPYSESLEQVLYAPPEPVVLPEETGTEPGEGGEEGEDTVDSSEEDVSSESVEPEDPSSEESYQTSDGMRLPQLPNVGGNSVASSPQGTVQTAPQPPSVSSATPSSLESAPETHPSDNGTSSESSASSGPVGVAGGAGSGGSGNTGVGTQAPSVPSITG